MFVGGSESELSFEEREIVGIYFFWKGLTLVWFDERLSLDLHRR